MSDLKELYKKLEIYRQDFDNHDNVIAFADTADEIILKQNPASIPVLLKYFDDNDHTGYVWEHLKNSLYYFGTKNYTMGVISNINLVMPRAKEFLISMFYRIFNDEECYAILKDNLTLMNKKDFLELLDIIYQESKNHRAQVEELRALMQNK